MIATSLGTYMRNNGAAVMSALKSKWHRVTIRAQQEFTHSPQYVIIHLQQNVLGVASVHIQSSSEHKPVSGN